MTTVGTQHTILGFGIATLGLVIGSGLSLGDRASVLTFGLIFVLFVPLFSAIVLTIWWGEVLRMIRAGDALALIEENINQHGSKVGWDKPALAWERALRQSVPEPVGAGHRVWQVHVLNFAGVYGAFTLIALIGIAMGLVNAYEVDHTVRPLLWVLTGTSALLGAVVFLFATHQLRTSKENSKRMEPWWSDGK